MNTRNLLSVFAVVALAACGAEGTSEAEQAEASPLEGAKKVVLGKGFACALAADSSVWCWGDNTYGQLGNGTNEGSARPVEVVGLEGEVKDVVAGEAHACALLASEAVMCWGNNEYGNLGYSGPGSSNVPVKVAVDAAGSPGFDVVGTGTCIIRPGGLLYCWGLDNQDTAVGGHVGAQAITSPSGTTNRICIIRSGTVICWEM